jgi:exopolyphosphatase/guanosine-5'-triphosphate,3'-diphosphate pyrophosphatase
MATAMRLSMPVRYGIVDMGSNAIRTQIVEVGDGRTPVVLQSRREAVRLGQDVFLTGTIAEPAITAAIDTMRKFKENCDQLGVVHVRAIATAALREATNRDLIVERIRAASGVEIEVITGSEEAYLLGVAVADKVDLKAGRSLLVDLGGGSVEVTLVEHGQVVSAESYRLGALRVLQALAAGKEQEQGDFLELLEQYVRSLDQRIREGFGASRIDRYVATGGNIESLADLIRHEGKGGVIDGTESYPLAALGEWAQRLALMTHAERVARLGLKPDRADTILPAAVVYFRLGQVAKVEQVLVPRVGLRDGLLREVLGGKLRAFHAKDHQGTVLASCRALGSKYHYDAEHARRVHDFALQLFDDCAALHRLGDEERILLAAASLLHDIGVFVSNSRHHRHSYYLIRESEIVGLTRHERELVGLIARYHRRAHPAREHEEYESLPRGDRLRVSKLAAMLRVADALDREHQSKIARIEVVLGKHVTELRAVPASGDRTLALERWSVEQKGGLWREVFGLPIRLQT